MIIAADLIRGSTDTIILACLFDKDSYGYEINKSVKEKSNGLYEMKEATLYTAFRRLEQLGYITSYWGDEGIGARRRYYSITESGKESYKKMLEDWQTASRLINRLVNSNEGEKNDGE